MLFFKQKSQDSNSNAADKIASSLKNAQALSEVIINSIADGVVLLDAKKNIIMFNPGAETITGWKKEDAVGLSADAVFLSSPPPPNADPIAERTTRIKTKKV